MNGNILANCPNFDLVTALESYIPNNAQEKNDLIETKKFLANNTNLYSRTNLQGHITGSGFLFNQDYSKVLLTHHKILNDWFQFGGHSDGDANTLRVALRETFEESGCDEIITLNDKIFDVDLQHVPANEKKKEPAHIHYDIRFIFQTNNENFCISDESNELRWFTMEDYAKLPQTAPRHRFLQKWRELRHQEFCRIMDFHSYLIKTAKEEGIQKIVAGGIVLNKQREILVLTRKPDDFLGGIDELPSGHLEDGETLLQGMTREIKEETGMDIAQIECYLDHFDYLSGSGKKTRQFNFVIIPKDCRTVTLTEHDAYQWQTAAQALANPKITPEVKKCIQLFQLIESIKQTH